MGEAEPARSYRPGDVANGHVLGADGQWTPIARAQAPATLPSRNLAGWSLALGLLSIPLADLALPQLAAIAFGVAALVGIRRGTQRGRGMAYAGITLGVLYLAVGLYRIAERSTLLG